MPRDGSSVFKGVRPMKTRRVTVEVRDRTLLTLVGLLIVLSSFVAGATVSGTISRWSGNILILDGASGLNGWQMDTDGLRGDFGSGADDFCTSNGSYITCGVNSVGYIASGTPETIASVYVNNVIAPFTYGGGTLPARAHTITDISWNVRTAGAIGSTNNTFQISDGTNTCNCTMACNQTSGSKIASCANGAGTGCVYAASAALTYSFSALGDCVQPMDVLGNMTVWGKWQ